MKHDNQIELKQCPRCGNLYAGISAISRTDNEMPICPDCGTREALQSIGVEPSEQEQIIETIHRHMERPSD